LATPVGLDGSLAGRLAARLIEGSEPLSGTSTGVGASAPLMASADRGAGGGGGSHAAAPLSAALPSGAAGAGEAIPSNVAFMGALAEGVAGTS
jgi:hypothetical protein